MADKTTRIAATGRVRTVEYAVRLDGTLPARAFLFEELHKDDRNALLALFVHVANNGEMGVNNDRLVKQERPPFWTFKCNKCKRSNDKGWKRIRLPFFRHGNRIIITHGFWKPPKAKWPEEQFTLAELIRQEFLKVEEAEINKKGAPRK